MILHSVKVFGEQGLKHIHISEGVIKTITEERAALDCLADDLRIELNGLTAFPGFINSHDHLDFNLFPPLGNGTYNNYTEWGKDIHLANKGAINAVEKIPYDLRVRWGLYKNLLNGFTTVVNHGSFLDIDNSIVDVFQDCHCLHSPAFERNWKWKLNKPFLKRMPLVMHVGEGTDTIAANEIADVLNWNLLRRDLVVVHGMAMKPEQAGGFKGLVWCPASNYFLFESTASVNKLMNETSVVFGTDSTLTAPWSAQKHFSLALDTGMVNSYELCQMLTSTPSALWNLNDRGKLIAGMKADILIADSLDDIFDEGLYPFSLIIKNGQISMLGKEMVHVMDKEFTDKMDKVKIREKEVLVQGGLHTLTDAILTYYPEAALPFELIHD